MKKRRSFRSILKTSVVTMIQPSRKDGALVVPFGNQTFTHTHFEAGDKPGLCADALFSAFTADIMKENKLFVR